MARIILPDTIAGIQKQLKDIKDKHTADGAASPLTILLTENGIDLAADTTALTNAAARDVSFGNAERDSEKFSKERDNIFDPVWKNMTTGVQVLKKIYNANPNRLGDWSITVDNDNRVVYPASFAERQQLVLAFWAFHLTFSGITSPLHSYITENTIVPGDQTDAADEALVQHNDFKAKATEAENMSEQRDNFLNPVIAHISLIGGYLIANFPTNPKKAGDWGFTIDDSPRKDVVRTGTVNPSAQKVLRSIAAGTDFKNTGTQPFTLMRGTTVGGTTKVIAPGQSVPITFGFGTSTIINTSGTDNASYEGTFNV